MISRLVLQILVGALTSLFLSLLFWFGAWRRAKSQAALGESSRLAKWIVAHRLTVTGFNFGVAMYVAMIVTPALADAVGGKGLNIKDLLIGIPIWALGGLFFGWLMSFSPRKRPNKSISHGASAKM